MSDGELILVAGALLAAGLAAALLASRLRVPSLILFLGVGMLIGTDGTGWIDFSDYELARTVGIIALALILFEGGLTSGLIEIRPVLGSAISLALVGTVLTAVLTGLAAAWLLRPRHARGDAARLDHRDHRRRRDLRAAARLDPAAEARRARSRARPASTTRSRSCSSSGSSSGSRTRASASTGCSSSSSRSSASASPLGVAVGWAGGRGPATDPPRHRRALPGRLADRRGALLRRRRRARRLRLPRRLYRRPRARRRRDPGEADDHHLPPGARLGRAGRPLPRPRPARLPERPRRRRLEGTAAGADRPLRRPADRRLRCDRALPVPELRAGRPLLGRACGGRSRSSSRPSP